MPQSKRVQVGMECGWDPLDLREIRCGVGNLVCLDGLRRKGLGQIFPKLASLEV